LDHLFMDNERVGSVNAMGTVDQAVGVLGGLGLRVVRRSAESLTLAVGSRADERTYHLAVRSRMTAPAASALAAGATGAGGEAPTLVVVPFMPDPAAEVLRVRGVAFVDLAGNAFVQDDGLRIDIRGRRPVRDLAQAVSPGSRRPFTRSGAQVTFCLLCWPFLAHCPVRELADISGTALGTTHAVLRDLEGAGYLVHGESGRALVHGGELLNRWAEAYALSLSPSLHLGHYRAPDPLWWRTAHRELAVAGVALGGEAAASELDNHLRPVTATLYAVQIPVQLLARHRCVKALDPRDANVMVRRRFWTAPDEENAVRDVRGLVPSVLIYGDLIISGEPRQRDHAQRLRANDDRLKRLDRS
jgi:hypothetical protein